MEFFTATPLFARFVYKRDESAVDKLEAPTRADPFVVVVDEMASLTSYFTDKRLRDEAEIPSGS